MSASDLQLDKLSPAELAELDGLLEQAAKDRDRSICEGSLAAFVRAAWKWVDPVPLVWNWHLDVICEQLESIVRGESRRDIFNVPPRSLKSTIVSVMFPAWVWTQERDPDYPLLGPNVQFLFVSYAQTVSEKDAIKTRDLILSPWYQELWGDRYSLLNLASRKFSNDSGGYRMASSVTGAVLGEGGHIIVIDDPISATDSNSEVAREAAIRWISETMPTRLNDPVYGAILLIMQRLHEHDPTGFLLVRQRDAIDEARLKRTSMPPTWRTLILPMEMDPARKDPLDRRTELGELLFPARFNGAAVAALKADLGPYAYATQYQQDGRPREGNIIKEEWWKMWPPARFCPNATGCTCSYHMTYPNFSFIVGALDTNYGEKETNDWSAFVKFGIWWEGGEPGMGGRPRTLMVGAWRDRLPLLGPKSREYEDPEARKIARGLTEKVHESCIGPGVLGVDVLLIENKTRGHDVAAELRKLLNPGEYQIILLDPVGSKLERVHSIVPMFADELVYAPHTSWAQMVIEEMLSFPKARHDDLTDCVAYVLHYLRKTGILFLTGETDPDMPPPDYGGERGDLPYDV